MIARVSGMLYLFDTEFRFKTTSISAIKNENFKALHSSICVN